jgi:hypothetical protein
MSKKEKTRIQQLELERARLRAEKLVDDAQIQAFKAERAKASAPPTPPPAPPPAPPSVDAQYRALQAVSPYEAAEFLLNHQDEIVTERAARRGAA